MEIGANLISTMSNFTFTGELSAKYGKMLVAYSLCKSSSSFCVVVVIYCFYCVRLKDWKIYSVYVASKSNSINNGARLVIIFL